MKDLLDKNEEWIGVDLDGTLAYYDHWRGVHHVGRPIPAMVERVKSWIQVGKKVKIFTARVAQPDYDDEVVQKFLIDCGIGSLPVTNQKDYKMVELWDDRCVQVVPNTGERVDGR